MDNPDEYIAQETLFGQRTDGERFPIKIAFGRPYKYPSDSPTEWACDLTFEPFLPKVPTPIHGEGSLHALCLASRFVHSWLLDFMAEGGKLTSENGEDFPLDAYGGPWRLHEVIAVTAPVELSDYELGRIRNALNEVCRGLGLSDEEFAVRLGFNRTEGMALIKKIAGVINATKPQKL